MSVTLTANYKEIFSADVVEQIDQLMEDNHDLDAILQFIDEYNEADFLSFYEEYVEQGEKCGYDIVDAFIEENGIVNVESCEEAFVGCYSSKAEFAEEFYSELYNLPCELVVDWEDTFDRSLYYDFTFVAGSGYREGYVFRSNF